MLVSIIIPIYNCGIYLKECLESVAGQSHQEFEALMINNGSTDDSKEICMEFAKKDPRFFYLELEKNSGGAGEPRNLGLKEAKGEFICFLDGDDRFCKDSLKILLSKILESQADVVIASYHNFSRQSLLGTDTILVERTLLGEKEVRDYFVRTYPNGEAGYLWNKIYRGSIIRENEISFPSLKRLEDGFFNVDFFSYAKKVLTIPEVTYEYRLNDQVALLRKSPPNYYEMIYTLLDHYYETIKNWNYEASFVEGEVCKFALNELEVCFENICYGPLKDAPKKEVLETLTKIRNHKDTEFLLKKKQYVGKYVARVMTLFEKGHYRRMLALVKLKIFAKSHLKRLFLFVKRWND